LRSRPVNVHNFHVQETFFNILSSRFYGVQNIAQILTDWACWGHFTHFTVYMLQHIAHQRALTNIYHSRHKLYSTVFIVR